MNCLSWNGGRLGNPRIVRGLRHLVKNKKPDLVFLMETKLIQNKASFFKAKLGFDNSFMVDSKGHSGGLILLWQSEWQVSIQNYSRRHINVVINMGSSGIPWKFMGFYGHPVVAKHHEAWSLLRCLASMLPIPWLCLDDFNEITSGVETSSTAVRPQKQIRDFQMALKDCHLSDLGFRGPLFT
jgi:hypothetical protein